MASTDARPVPRKNTAYRVYFPILDNDGDLVSGASGLDSEISNDGGAFADCTNEATEIAQGIYYLDLTNTEMNADAVVVIVKTSTSDAKTTVITLYPEEAGDFRADVTHFGGSAGTFSGGRPEVNATHLAGTAYASADLSATMKASINAEADTAISDAALATAANLATVDGVVDAIKTKTDNLPSDPADASVIVAAFDALPTAAENATAVWGAGTRTLTSGANIALAKGTGVTGFNDLSAAQVNAEVDAALSDYDPPTRAELTSDKDEILAVLGTPAGADLSADIAQIYDAIDTEIAAILEDTSTTLDDLIDTEIAAIKAKTDSLTFTVAGVVDANIQRVNDVSLTGDGSATPWGPA